MVILANKNVLITGGSSGIGKAIAIAFAKEGANVLFTYNNQKDEANHTLESMGDCIFKKAIKANLLNLNEITTILEEAERVLGSIDILVNNAGMVTRFPNFLDILSADLEALLTINLKAPFLLMQGIATQMKNRGTKGSIINISSMSAEITTPGLSHYEASKAALNALTRGAANDLASYSIRVNTIAPGLIETNMNKNQRERDPKKWNLRQSKIPLCRAGQPNDIASVAIFLGSPQSEWITGAIIPVDGGLGVYSPFGN